MAPKHGQECDASPGLRNLSKPAPRGRLRGVLEATPPALTEACSGSADRPLPRGPLSGGGLGPRSLALPLSQHSRPTDLGLAIVSTMSTPCRSCAINTFVKLGGLQPLAAHGRGASPPVCRSCCGLFPALHVPSIKSVQSPAHTRNKNKQTNKQNKQIKQTNRLANKTEHGTQQKWELLEAVDMSLAGNPGRR